MMNFKPPQKLANKLVKQLLNQEDMIKNFSLLLSDYKEFLDGYDTRSLFMEFVRKNNPGLDI